MDNNQVAPADHVEDKLKMVPEPFGYFRCTLDGWVDCAETDEGARPLYEYSEIAKRDAEIDEVAIALSETNVARMRLIDELTTLRAQMEVMKVALRYFVGAKYPVDKSINQRGYSWTEAYLDQALPYAVKALATYQSTQGQLK